MPNTDGVQLARQIKADPITRDVILISLSSISDPLKPRTMSDLGFVACLTKPALPSQLYNAIVDSLAADSSNGAPTPPPVAMTLDAVAPRLDGVRVLLAEDNEVNQLVASELLQQAGCQCELAVNGRQAVDKALAGTFDVILMDCQMPELDGFEATRLIRQIEQSDAKQSRRPIIALTANAIKGDRELCLAAGMDGYVTKPIDPIELLQTIRSFIPARRISPEIATRAAVEPIADLASPPPVDLEALRRRCMGNRKIAAKALAKFDSSMTVDVDALARSVQSGDAKAAAASAHKIKGAAANVSAEGLRKIATELEKRVHDNEMGQTQECLEQLQREMDRFKEYLATALGELTVVSTEKA